MEAWKDAYQEGVRCIQVILGNPRTYNSRPLPEREKRFLEVSGLELICHGPYTTSLVAHPDSKIYKLSRSYYNTMTRHCLEAGIKTMVLHVGGISEGQSIREAQSSISSFLLQWALDFAGRDITLCLETDPGSKNGRRVGGIRFLYPIVKMMDNPQIRLCWDWEHSYANGLALDNMKVISQVLDVTDVMHVNAIPTYVERGSHLDRHSETNFTDSKYPVEIYKNIIEVALRKSHDIKCILERRDWSIAKVDLDEIKSWRLEGLE